MNNTKGEWKVTDSAFSRFTTYRGKRQGGRTFVTTALNLNQVAEAQGDTQEEAEANAHLIAAAPDMYEALKALLRWAELSYTNDTGEWADENDPTIVLTKKAIAKAEGK